MKVSCSLLLVFAAGALLVAAESATTISSHLAPSEEDHVSTEENVSSPSSSTLRMTEAQITTTTSRTPPSRRAKRPSSRSSSPKPEERYNFPCNQTGDCQPNSNLQCIRKHCLCETSQLFDITQQRCVIPLGSSCNPDMTEEDNLCPKFAECFMERCVCKTGYSMFSMTRCKADDIGFDSQYVDEKSKTVLWPRHQSSRRQGSVDRRPPCTKQTCDESRGLKCQSDGACKCKNSRDFFIDEFGQCMNTTELKPLKDALISLDSVQDDLKSFVKLLDRVDKLDQETGTSEHYNSPIHQLSTMLLGADNKDGSNGRGNARSADSYSAEIILASPRSYSYDNDDDHMSSGAQQSAPAASTLPNPGVSAGPHTETAEHAYPTAHSYPTHGDAGNSQPLAYGLDSDSRELYGNQHNGPANDHYHVNSPHLDNYQTQPQNVEPSIVQRQVPYGDHAEGHPSENYGVIPEGTRHFRMPFGLGGHHPGLGHFDHDHQGHHGGHHGHGHPEQHHHAGHHHRPHHGHSDHHNGHLEEKKPEKKKTSIIAEIGEILGKSFKLIDKFLPLIHAVNGLLKKEAILDKKKEDISDHDHHDDHRDKRYDEEESKQDKKRGNSERRSSFSRIYEVYWFTNSFEKET